MFRTVPLSKTCRVSFLNKFEKLVHLVGFITRIVTLHYIGQMLVVYVYLKLERCSVPSWQDYFARKWICLNVITNKPGQLCSCDF
jgi:hypothetical protein